MSTANQSKSNEDLPLQAAWRPGYNPWLIAITVTLATFMEVLDTSIANVALPHIAGSLSAGQDESTWVLTSYLVSNAIILPVSGWFSQMIGRKRFYMLCVALFTVSSALCGMSTSLGMLVFFRVLQGLGGGGLQPSEQAIMADTFEPAQRGMAFAVYAMAVVTAPALGPTIGGWITDNFDWRWIFWINIPVGIISILLTSRLVEDPPYLAAKNKASKSFRIDYIGFALIALSLGTLQVVLDKGEREDWFASSFIVWFMIISAISGIAAVWWELKSKHPVVDLRLLGERNFAMANLLMFFLGFVLLGSTVLLPQMLQTLMGYPATDAGMVLLPGGLTIIALLPFIGRALNKGVQPKYMIMFGLLLSASGLWWMSHFSLEIDFRHAALARMLQASGLAFLFVPINTMSYAYLPPGKNNDASGIVNLSRNMGSSVGIALVTTLLARQSQVHQTSLTRHTTSYDPAFANTLASIKASLVAHGMSSADAANAALERIYLIVQKQAMMLAYLDAFRWLMLVFLVLIPVAMTAKKLRGRATVAAH